MPCWIRSTRDEPTVGVRVLLERGRVLNTSGHPEMAVPLFEQAAELADHLGEEFLAVDALHMLAIADSAHAETWTRSALEYASTVHDERTKRWMVALHNNLGWTLHDAGRSPRPWWSSSSPNSGRSGSAPRGSRN